MKKDNPNSIGKTDSNLIQEDRSASKKSEKSLLSSKIAKSGVRKNKTDKNQRKGLIVIGLLVLVFFVLLVILIYKLPESPEVSEDDQLPQIDTANIRDVFSFEPHEASRYHSFNDKLVYFSQDQLAIKNYSGEIIYQEQIEFDRPIAVQSDLFFIAGDRNSSQLIVLDDRTKKFTLYLDGVFAGAYFGADQYLAVIDENPEKPGYVHIVDLSNGEKILTLQFVESGYPLAISFSNNLDFFDVLLINTKGSTLQPIIKRYDLEGNQLGQKMPGEHPFLYGKIFHDQSNNIVLGSTSNLLVLDLEQEEPIAEYSSGRVFEIISNSKLTAFTSMHLDGNLKIVSWDESNKRFTELEIDTIKSLDGFISGNNLIAFYANNSLRVYDQNKNTIVLDQMINADIVRIGFNDNQLVLITKQGVKILDL